MTTVPPNDFALIESIVNALPAKAQEDARAFFQAQSAQVAELNGVTGVSTTNAQNVAPPPQGSISVSGANAVYTVTITPPALPQPVVLWHRVSYSQTKGFTSGVTQLEPTTSTSLSLNLPGQSLFFRLESSFNKQVWNQPVLAAQTALASGLVSSAATNEAGSFNQTNLAVVTSVAVGSSAAVQVQGAGGSLTSLVTLKGSVQSVLPAATIVGVTPGSTQYVGADGEGGYVLRPTLGALLDDGITPIGKLSVVSTAAPTPPTIVPVISNGYIIGYSVTDGGAGASGPYTLTYGSVGSGSGATFGEQTIVGGVLIAIAPGNPGNGAYADGTTVTASGGTGLGTPGGGTAEATTAGRLTL